MKDASGYKPNTLNKYKMNHLIIKAISYETKEEILIRYAERGRACNAFCSVCEQRVLAAKGEERIHHFKHDGESTCQGMTPLHKLAQEIISEERILYTLKGSFRYKFIRKEQPIGKYFCDVEIRINGKLTAVEILVTHDDHPEKTAYYNQEQIPSIKLNLSDLPHDIDKDSLRSIIVSQPARFSFIFWEKEQVAISVEPQIRIAPQMQPAVVVTRVDNWLSTLLYYVAWLLTGIFIYKMLSPQSHYISNRISSNVGRGRTHGRHRKNKRHR